MKGLILKINPNVQLVDICHSIKPQCILQGALALKSSYRYFPKKTIFLCVVDPGVGPKREAVIVKTKDYLFVVPDNGILSLVVDAQASREIYAITNVRYFVKPVSNTFHGRDIFAPVAAYIASGIPLHKFGKMRKDLKRSLFPELIIERKKRCIVGEIIDIDHFGNCITNIEEKHLAAFKGNPRITCKGKMISHLASSYAQVKKGESLAIIGSKGYLEISVNMESAAKKFNARNGNRIEVLFY